MTPIVVSDVLAVGEFPSPEQIEILAKAGFRSILNNQPDGEVDRFPGSAAVAAAASRHGLASAYAPIASRHPSTEELALFAEAMNSLPAPIYAFCYSGSRSAAACAFTLTEAREADAIIAEFDRAGFDIASLKPWLEDERQRRVPAKANGTGNGPAHGAAPVAGASAQFPLPEPASLPAASAVQGIVVHARAAGFGGFAM